MLIYQIGLFVIFFHTLTLDRVQLVNLTQFNNRFKNVLNIASPHLDFNLFGSSLVRDVMPDFMNPNLTNSSGVVVVEEAPDFLMNKPPITTTSSSLLNQDFEYLTINLNQNHGPQSFAVLMNFQVDGTSSYQFINQNYMLMAAMSGMCSIGEIYNPILNDCEQIFCTEGYTFTSKGCVSLNNAITTNMTDSQPIKNPPGEIQIELTVFHKFCLHLTGFNETYNCTHHLILNTADFLNQFKQSLSDELRIKTERIANLTILSHDKTAEEITINDDLIDNSTAKSKTYIIKSERTRLSFVLKDYRNITDENMETIVLFYILSNMAMEYKPMKIANHQVILSEISEIESSSYDGWCNSNGDYKLFVRKDFRILASFNKNQKPSYFIYVNETDSVYKTGDFYLTIAYAPTNSPDLNISAYNRNYNHKLLNMNSYRKKRNVEEDTFKAKHLNWNLESLSLITDEEISKLMQNNKTFMSLVDVTEYIFDDKNSSEVYTQKYLTVCQRVPKIRVACLNHETVRVRLCELEYQEKNRSFCSLLLNECYSINQYEYDNLMPTEYIRICKYRNKQDLDKSIDFNKKLENARKSNEILNQIHGYLSFISIIVSLIFLVATFVTYLLFKQLRSLPTWNIINLVFALFIAQFTFLVGSLVSSNKDFCFVISIFSHYGFLAAFFWMNIIAFDLFRNFRSNVILKTITLKERLPQYLVYGWVSPFLIVLICLIIDLTVKISMDDTYFRPCYAGYLEGCANFHKISLNQNDSFGLNETLLLSNKTTRLKYLKMNNQTTLIEACTSNLPQVYLIKILSSTCWIQNGKANLLYFGIPIAVIIVVNSVFFFITIYNIRRRKSQQKESNLRRASKSKMPSDKDVKFYIQIAFILGFTWIIGFFLTTFSSSNENLNIIYQILIYLFILLNALIGVFIFFVFLFKKETLRLYVDLIKCVYKTKKKKRTFSEITTPSRSKNSSLSSTDTFVST